MFGGLTSVWQLQKFRFRKWPGEGANEGRWIGEVRRRLSPKESVSSYFRTGNMTFLGGHAHPPYDAWESGSRSCCHRRVQENGVGTSERSEVAPKLTLGLHAPYRTIGGSTLVPHRVPALSDSHSLGSCRSAIGENGVMNEEELYPDESRSLEDLRHPRLIALLGGHDRWPREGEGGSG